MFFLLLKNKLQGGMGGRGRLARSETRELEREEISKGGKSGVIVRR